MTVEMLPWVISRATGITAIILLAAAMMAGLLVRTREPLGTMRGAGLVDLHRLLSATALVVIGVHGTALLFDTTEPLTPLELIIPGLNDYRPFWTGLGVIAAELALVVHFSFRLRGKLGVTFWRRLHFATYLVFVLGIAHGIGAGTDAGTQWALAIYGGAVAGVFALTGWRIVTAKRRPKKKPSGAGRMPPPRQPGQLRPRPRAQAQPRPASRLPELASAGPRSPRADSPRRSPERVR